MDHIVDSTRDNIAEDITEMIYPDSTTAAAELVAAAAEDSLNNDTADTADTADTTDTTDPADDYMQRFDNVELRNKRLDAIAQSIDRQPDQDQRLFAVIRYVKEVQKLNNDMYDLLVEMNNFFAPK